MRWARNRSARARVLAVAVAAVTVTAIGLIGATPANASSHTNQPLAKAAVVVHPLYTAGSAVAGTPGYDVATWSKTYTCSFAGWAHVQVNWQCWLEDPFTHVRLGDLRTGGFSGGGTTTPTWYYHTSNVYLCTEAYAAYADGSDSDDDERCA